MSRAIRRAARANGLAPSGTQRRKVASRPGRHGEVVFAGQTLLRTGNVGSYDWADAAARTASVDRVRAVFGTDLPDHLRDR